MSLLTEKRGRLTHVGKELKRLSDLEQLSGEQTTELDTYMAEWDALLPEVERLQNAQDRAAQASKYGESAGRVAGAEALAGQDGEGKGTGGRQIVRRLSAGQQFAQSEAVKEFNRLGANRSEKVRIGGTDGTKGEAYDGSGPADRYTLIDSADLPGFMVPPMVVPDIKRPRDYALTARDVLINGRTTSDTIYFLRELVFTNSAAETAEATSFDVTALGSGGRKPESALTFEEASAPVKTIAHWIPITRQAIQDTAQLQTYVENRLLVGLERRFNSQVWNGDGSGATLTGILNTTGIQDLDGVDFGADPTMNDGTQNQNFERILRAITEIEMTADAMATFVALNPYDLEKFQTVTDDNRQYLGGGPFSGTGVTRIWGLPVARDRAIPEGHAVVGDGTMAAIWDREDAAIFIDTINDQFVRNMLTILAEMRAALTVFRPAAFADVTLAAWS